MSTTEIKGATYSIGRLTPRQSFHVMRRLIPVQAALFAALEGAKEAASKSQDAWMAALLGPVGDAVARLPEADVDYLFDTCLAVVSRQQAERFAPIQVQGQLMFADIDMSTMLRLTMAVVKENLSDFFGGLLDETPSTPS